LLDLYNWGSDREEWTALLARIGHNRRSGDSDAQNKYAITHTIAYLISSTTLKALLRN
jgi:hypothetical protein